MESAEGDMIMSMVMQELKSKDTRTMSSPGVFVILVYVAAGEKSTQYRERKQVRENR